MKKRVDVLFYVQHLLGIGHLVRAALVARSLTRSGFDVLLVSGGMPVPTLNFGAARFIQLPPVRAGDLSFKTLIDQSGSPVSDSWKQERKALLLAILRTARPRVLLIETFPFGRRQMRFELCPLLEEVREKSASTWVICSVRDILSPPSTVERASWILDNLDDYFDFVLVHGDPAIVPFDRTFPNTSRVKEKVRYTGYVVDHSPISEVSGSFRGDEVVVSAGGGAVAEPLIRAAFSGRQLTPFSQTTWRILVGPNLPDHRFQDLCLLAPRGVFVERSRSDFPSLLSRCALSISQAGYNTLMDVLRARPPAVVVPFAGGAETEQSLRARLFESRGWLAVVEESTLGPDALADGVFHALQQSGRATGRSISFANQGAKVTSQFIGELIRGCGKTRRNPG